MLWYRFYGSFLKIIFIRISGQAKKKKSFKSSKLGDQNNVSIYDTDEEFGEERLGGKIMKSSFQFCVSDVGR